MFSLNSNKDKQINTDLFDTSTIEQLGTAKNKDFHSKFFTADRVTYWLGLFGQFLSAITEAVFIFRGVGGKLPLIQVSNIGAVTAALIGVYFFEVVGVRVYLVSIVRQITSKDFKTENEEKTSKQKVTLFIFNICFCGSILFANFSTSLTGQSTSFISVKSNVDNSDTLSKIDIELQIKIDTIRANANRYTAQLEAKAEQKSKDIKAFYVPVLADLRASKWVEGASKIKINADITKTNKEQTDKLEVITTDLANRINQVDTTTKKSIATLENIAQIKKDAILKSENSDLSIYAMIESYSYYLLLLFMSLSIIAIIYREVYISGSKQELKVIDVKKRPVLIVILLYGLYMKFYHLLYWLTVKIVGSKAFNYSKVMQSKEDYLSTEVSNNEQLQKAIDYLNPLKKNDQQTAVQISAYGQNNTGATNLRKGSAFQDVTQKQTALSKYKIQTVQSWFKRSDLVENSESKTEKGMENNRRKYLQAKKDLSTYGVQFLESKNSVSIKI